MRASRLGDRRPIRTSPLAAAVCAAALAAHALPAGEVDLHGRSIRIPDGFEIELAAGPPLVERPIAVARDERGRLYVTDSAGMTDRAERQREVKPHRIRRLEDRDGDGRYDAGTLFAEGVMFPEGAMWYRGSLYVAAPPEIWKFTDEDDDGRSDRREVWYDGKTLTGCANDLHGPYLGPDGRFYFCKGAFAEQRHTLPDGRDFVTRASHIFRARPDGRELEPVLTGGMDNPVNVAFSSVGERFLSCTFFQFPADGKRDGLIHAIYGGVYGKEHDSILEHPRTGSVMPVLVHQGAAAPCGLAAGSASLFGGGFEDRLLACYFNLHQVVEHELVPSGATFATRDRELVGCDHPDFHPTDVFEDADGSLLVVDTGGWYKVCCPTSQLAKPDVLGAIYRLRKTGVPRPADPLGAAIDWKNSATADLVKRLADKRLFVRRRAVAELRGRGLDAVAELTLQFDTLPAASRRLAVWTLADIEGEPARSAIRSALADPDRSVVQAAIHAAGLWRDVRALPLLMERIEPTGIGGIEVEKVEPPEGVAPAPQETDAPAVLDEALFRAACEALGRMRRRECVPVLLAAAASPPPPPGGITPAPQVDDSGAPSDPAARIREHAIVYALIEIADAHATAAGLRSPDPAVRRAAMVALDQMPDGSLQAGQVVPCLSEADPRLRQTAVWIVEHRPEWAADVVGQLEARLGTALKAAEAEELARLLASLARAVPVQQLLARTAAEAKSPRARRTAWQAMARASLPAAPAEWLDLLAARLPALDDAELAEAVAAARRLPLPKAGHHALQSALLDVGGRPRLPLELRMEALQAAGPGGEWTESALDTLVEALGKDQPLAVRLAAADVVGRAALNDVQRAALLPRIAQAGPIELPRLLAAYERGGSSDLGRRLVEAIGRSPGKSGLREEALRAVVARFPDDVQDAAAPLIAELRAAVAEQAAQLDRLLAELPPGDVRRGHELFVGKKASCITCHTLGYHGGRLGPDLTNIGKVRNERDLLESIVFPSASFVRGYEPVSLELHDGQVLSGIIVQESRDDLVLALDADKRQRILRTHVAAVHPQAASIMPQGMLQLLSKQELADLVAFLKSPLR